MLFDGWIACLSKSGSKVDSGDSTFGDAGALSHESSAVQEND